MVSFTELNALYAAYKYEEDQEDHIYYVKPVQKEELAAKIVQQSVNKQILTDLTAYICVDESLADEVLKSKQKDEKEKVIITGMNPKGHTPSMKVVVQHGDDYS